MLQGLQLRRKVITAEIIKESFLRKGEEEHTLSDIIRYHNEMSVGVLAQGTMKNYYTTQRYLMELIKVKYRHSEYFLSELNYKFIQDLEIYLRSHQPANHQKTLNNNGIMKHLERFRKMINLSFRLEWIIRDPFEKFQLKYNKVEVEYLTGDELNRLEKKDIMLPRLCVVRDIFVFCCYTGLAFVDVMNLRHNHVVTGQDGNLWINTSRQKTTISVKIPLLETPLVLIEQYKSNVKAILKGTIFPQLSNQKMNSYLKELADICGILKILTFHVARHTFATTVTLVNGVPMETVSKLLGHTTLRSTQVYSKVIEKKVSEDMSNLGKCLQISSDPISEEFNVMDIISGNDTYAKMILWAFVETKSWIAPILRESPGLRGLKIAVDVLTFNNYLNYRLRVGFSDWFDFYERGKNSMIIINYSGNSALIPNATSILNNSRYSTEGKFQVEFQRIVLTMACLGGRKFNRLTCYNCRKTASDDAVIAQVGHF